MADLASPEAQAEASAKRRPKRAEYTFPVPESERLHEVDPHSVTLVAITVEEEQMAIKAATSDKKALKNLDYELVKIAWAKADGKALDWVSGQRDELFEAISPKARQLLIKAWEKIHAPSPKGVEDFLAGMVIEV